MTDQSNSQAVATTSAQPARGVPELYQRFGARYGVEPRAVGNILKSTAFKTKDGPPSNEQMAALLIVADQYRLNPFTKEIFAFPDKQNGIVPVVGVDGWNRITNEHPQYDGEEIEIAPRDEWTKIDEDAQLAPPWMKIRVYRKDRKHPIEHTEYLDECYRAPFKTSSGHKLKGPWQTHTKRMLEHKTRIQGRRTAFGFSGIYDEDEAQRVVDSEMEAYEAQSPQIINVEQYHALLDLAAGKLDVAPDRFLDALETHAEMLGHAGRLGTLPVAAWERLMEALRSMPDIVDGEATEETAEEPSSGPVQTTDDADGTTTPPDPPKPANARRGRSQKIAGEQVTTLASLAQKLEPFGFDWQGDMAKCCGGVDSFMKLNAEQADKLIDRWSKALGQKEKEAAEQGQS